MTNFIKITHVELKERLMQTMQMKREIYTYVACYDVPHMWKLVEVVAKDGPYQPKTKCKQKWSMNIIWLGVGHNG